MEKQSTEIGGCTLKNSSASRFKRASIAASSFQLAQGLAIAAATGLVIASVGLGAIYAWGLGSEHGVAMASLLVLMAMGLESAKPIAVAAASTAFRAFSFVRGAALTMLAVVAIGYSLSAELSLMATARGDLAAERAASSSGATIIRERYRNAKLEFDRLPPTRPSAELQLLIDGVLIDPRAGGCATIDGSYTREHCPRVVQWKAEQARAHRRSQLEGELRNAEREMAGAPVVKAADPGASALATYLAVFGLKIKPQLLSEVLVLLGILGLEVGSTMAGVLVQATASRRLVRASQPRRECAMGPFKARAVVQLVQSNEHGPADDGAETRERVKEAIMNQLAKRGGSVSASERGLAALIGASRPTVRRAIRGLVADGLIALETSRSGSVLRLSA